MIILNLFIFLAIGSYLNSLAYRLLNLEHFWATRSFCPSCKKQIAWYDNIPVISWILLQARCRSCKKHISWLYPFIEILTTFALLLLWQISSSQYFIAYFLFFSALIVTIRTDFDQLLISRFATLYLIPVGIIAAMIHRLPISLTTSIAGTLFGYVILWLTKKISLYMTGQEGIGQGDLELLACIGSFTGPIGCWISLLVGSITGTSISIIYMGITKQKIKIVPFGAYLSLGAMVFVLWQDILTQFFLCM